RFRRHRVAMLSVVVLIILYLTAAFAEFVAPYDPNAHNGAAKFMPPQVPSFIDGNGNFTLRPVVFPMVGERNPETLRMNYTRDETTWYPISFFVAGAPYKLWGLWETNIHLFGLGQDAPEDATFYLLGSDRLGRDMFSRIVYGARISLSIGLVSVFLSLVFGIVLGGISGYYGGHVDNIIQRIIEFIRSIPSIP